MRWTMLALVLLLCAPVWSQPQMRGVHYRTSGVPVRHAPGPGPTLYAPGSKVMVTPSKAFVTAPLSVPVCPYARTMCYPTYSYGYYYPYAYAVPYGTYYDYYYNTVPYYIMSSPYYMTGPRSIIPGRSFPSAAEESLLHWDFNR